MGLFTKNIGAIFLKEEGNAEEYIRKLQDLGATAEGELKERIDKQITIAKYGLVGESNVAFELKNSGYDMYILHDICLQHRDMSAQIDYLVVTRKHIYVIECKNLIGNIEVDNAGNFIRTYELFGRKIKEGIYSPITQNTRHLQVMKELRKNSKSNFLLKMLFEKSFDTTYKSLIVLANPKTLLNAKFAKKEVKEQIVRADQLINKIKEMDGQQKDNVFSEKDMLEIANFYLALNQSERSDYAKKYEEILAEKEDETNEIECSCGVDTRAEDEIEEDKSVEESTVEVERESIKEKLRAYRLEQSRLQGMKPYYIFTDVQMEDLISKNPQSKEELLSVSGFGSAKVEKYGDNILKLLKES